MKEIKVTHLHEGHRLEHALYLPTGQKLLNPRTSLTERHIELLLRQPHDKLILADSIQELVDAGLIKPLENNSLKVGQRASRQIVGAGGGVLIEEGQDVEDYHLEAMRRGGFFQEKPVDPAERDRERKLMADLAVEDLQAMMDRLPLRVTPQQMEIWDNHRPDGSHWPAIKQLTEWRERHVGQLRQLFGQLYSGNTVSVEQFEQIIDELQYHLLNHRRQFAQLALLCPRREDYLPDHAYTCTVLAMATAAQMTWAIEDIRRMGMAAMLFDLGMMLVPRRIRTGGFQLTDIDRNLVHRHPAFSLVLMSNVERLDERVKMAAYQHHERENGSGYPYGARQSAICDYARALAVVDVFSALTSPRNYRKMRLPYQAMETVVKSAAANQFYKPAARALVQSAGLFPVGSYVELSSRKFAFVLAANPNHIDRPVIEPIDEQGNLSGKPVDMSDLPVEMLAVVRPVDEAEARSAA